MNRNIYFNYIEEKLNVLACRVKMRGKLNLLDLNIHSETFFSDLLNIVYEFNLKNLNAAKRNFEGIDLIDEKNKIVIQVSSTCTKQKLEDSLTKDILDLYEDYTFKFVSISEGADSLRTKSFSNPHGISFSPSRDIIDISTILNIILHMPYDRLNKVYEFIKNELGTEIQPRKIDSNLTAIINILANENLSDSIDSPEINTYEIDKKISFNNLTAAQDMIDEYKVYYHKLDEKYSEFDKQGSNRSLSVFRIMKSQYIKLSKKYDDSSDLFFAIVDAIANIVTDSKNYTEIPVEELEMCVHILVVDAFIRCKIFKNPEGYSHVTT